MSAPSLVALQIAEPPERWTGLGFGVDDHGFVVGGVRFVLAGEDGGLVAWRVSGVPTPVDGLPTSSWLQERLVASRESGQVSHPNGAVGVDHLVVVTPDFERTSSALDAAGMSLRRVRAAASGFRQGFRRLGPAILEIVEAPQAPPGPARFWGLTFAVTDLDALAVQLGPQLGQIRPAVQPGRRIAPLAGDAGVCTRVAFMDQE